MGYHTRLWVEHLSLERLPHYIAYLPNVLTTRQETNQMPINLHFHRAKDTHFMDHIRLQTEHIIDNHTTLLTFQTTLITRQETNQLPISVHFDRAKDTHSMCHIGLWSEHIIYARATYTIIFQMILLRIKLNLT